MFNRNFFYSDHLELLKEMICQSLFSFSHVALSAAFSKYAVSNPFPLIQSNVLWS